MTARRCPLPRDWQRTELPYTTRRRWAAPAPAVPVTPPAVTVVRSSRAREGGIRLRLRFAANGAETSR